MDRLPSFRVGYAIAGLAVVYLLVAHERMPMIDLPGHESQIAAWLHYDDPRYGFADEFEFNWFTPYVLGYGLVYLAAQLVSIQAAFKIVIALAALATPLVLLWILRRSGGEPYWALFGFPLFFGHSFHWGFYNYLIAVPIGLVAIELCRRFSDSPSNRRAVAAGLTLAMLFFAHGIVFALAWLIGFLVCLVPPSDRLGIRLAPFVASVVIPVVYTLAKSSTIPAQTIWELNIDRLLFLLASPLRSWDPFAVSAGAASLIAILVLCGGIRRPSKDHIPFAVFVCVYLFAPTRALFTDFIFHRLDVFVSASFLWILCRPATLSRRRMAGVLTLVSCLLFVGVLHLRFEKFNRQMDGFDEVAAAIPLNSRVTFLDEQPWRILHPFHQLDQELIASRGAVIDKPWGVIWQMLLRVRQDYEREARPRFIVARLPELSCPIEAAQQFAAGTVTLVRESQGWCLFEAVEGFEVVSIDRGDGA